MRTVLEGQGFLIIPYFFFDLRNGIPFDENGKTSIPDVLFESIVFGYQFRFAGILEAQIPVPQMMDKVDIDAFCLEKG